MPLQLKGTVKPGLPDKRYYMIRVQVNGRREVLSSGTRDRRLAEKKEQTIVDALQANIDIPKIELQALIRGSSSAVVRSALRAGPPRLTLEDAERRCFSDPAVWGRIRSQATYRANLRHIKEFFGADKAVADIKSEDMVALVEKLLEKGLRPGGIDRILAAASRLFGAARDWMDEPFTTPKIPFLNESQPRRWVMSPEIEPKFFEALRVASRPGKGFRGPCIDGESCIDLFVVLLDTGMRFGEAKQLRWEDIVERDGVMMIRLWRRNALKTAASVRTIPATPRVRETLNRLRDSVLIGPFVSITKSRALRAWRIAKKALGITDWDCVIHSLRHTCGTRLLEATNDIRLVQEWLGHENIVTTSKVYAHVPSHRLVGASEALARLAGTRKEDQK